MKNKSVKLVLSLVVLAVLCGAYFGVQNYVKHQEEKESEQEEETTEEVFSVNADEIQSLQFIVDKNETTFVKEDDTWYKDDEREFPVDQDVLSEAASSISQIDADRVFDNVENLNEYDLDSPQNTVTVTTTDGNETVIRVGMKNDSTSQYYISLNDEKNKVYVVDAGSVEPYLNSLYDYAKAGEFPAVDSNSITKISVDKDDGSYQFVKDTDTDLWYAEDGENREKLDSSKISTLTGSIGSLSYASFVDYNCTDDTKYGFDSPYAVLNVEYQEEETVEESGDSEDSGEALTDTEVNGVEEDGAVESDSEEGDSEEGDIENSIEDDDTEEDNAAESDSEEVDMENSIEDDDTEEDSTTESDSEDGIMEENDIEQDDAEQNDSEDSDTEEEPETRLVDKKFTLYIGDVTGDDRYVRLDDSKEIYTLSIGTITGLVDKGLSDYWDLTVNYLSISQLENMDVEKDNEKHSIHVSRETTETESDDSTDSETGEDANESNTTTTVKYELDGTELENTTNFITFYNKLNNLVAQDRLTDEYSPDQQAEMIVDYENVDGEKSELEFYEYDANFYAAVLNTEKVYLINKMTFRELTEAYDKIFES